MEISPSAALNLIKDKQREFSKLYTRMKADADLAKRKSFYLTDDAGKKIPNCEHVTLPKAAIFANRANAIMAAANQQITVEGQGLDDKQTSKKEMFFFDSLDIADQLLGKRGMPKHFTFQGNHVNLRGRVAQRVIVEIDDEGNLKVELIPWDMLFATYDFDTDGTAWAGYTTKRSKAMIESEYGITPSGSTGKITDFEGKDINYIFLDDKHIDTQPNSYGYVPVAIALSPAGLLFLDDDMEENRGESIFWLNRDLYKEANRIVSIVQTLNSGALFPPLQKEYEEIPLEKPPAPVAGTRMVVPVKKGELYHPMPREDVYQATRMAWSIIDSHIQQGSFSTIEFGTLQFPLSAVALENLAEGRELVLAPGLQALSMLYLQTCQMIKDQFIKLNKSIEIRGKGKQATYAPKDLDGDYNIFFRYFTGSRKYALAGISEAQAIGNLVSDDYKRRELIRIENPDEEAEKIRTEQLEKMNPAILYYKQIQSLVEQERWAEAWLVRKQLMDMVRQQFAPPQVEEAKQPVQTESAIPLFSGAPSKVGGRQPGGITAEETKKAAAVQEQEFEEA